MKLKELFKAMPFYTCFSKGVTGRGLMQKRSA